MEEERPQRNKFAASVPIRLDACCLLNLHATRRVEAILQALPARFALADEVRTEAIYIFRGGDGEDAHERESIDLGPLVQSGLIEILRIETDQEMASFVRFAAELDDGEAMTLALAVHRGGAVATDDRKTLRVLRGLSPPIDSHTTVSLIKHWAESEAIEADALRQVLIDVEQRGRFVPGRHDPLRMWWQAMLQR